MRERVTRLLDPGRPRLLTLGMLALAAMSFARVVPTLSSSICDEHRWRQADTYAMAQNFFESGFDLLHPRIDRTNGRSGIMGMEAPVAPAIIAVAMRMFGPGASTARHVVFALALVSLLAFARGLSDERLESRGAAIVLLAALSPACLYELRQIQPDPVMLACMFLSGACFRRFALEGRRADYALGQLALVVGALAKSPMLVAGPALFLLSVSSRPIRFRQVVVRASGFVLPLLAVFAWNSWAAHLNATYNAGEAYFKLDFSKATVLADLSSARNIRNALLFLVPIYDIHWATIPAVIVGMVASLEKRERPVGLAMWVWLASAVFFLCAFSSRTVSHWYYALPAVPPLLYFGGTGLATLIEIVRVRMTLQPRHVFAASLLLPMAFVAWGAYDEPLTGERVPGANGAMLQYTLVFDAALAALALFMTIAAATAIAFAEHVSERRATVKTKGTMWTTWLRVSLGMSVLAAMSLPFAAAYAESGEVLAFRSHATTCADTQARMRALRRAVDRVSTRRDVFVVNGGDPWFLHVANRRGFSDSSVELSSRDIRFYRRAGARFYVRFFEGGPEHPTLAEAPIIARGPSFALHCLDPRGCPPL